MKAGMGTNTSIYSLPDGDGDETKTWYMLGLSMRINFLCRDEYGIVKPVLVPTPLPSLTSLLLILAPPSHFHTKATPSYSVFL